jgi:hypothetical protein
MVAGKPLRRHFLLVGECLFNDFEVYDCVLDGDDDSEDVLSDGFTFCFH